MTSGITIQMELSGEALEALRRSVNGSGGFQSLLRSLQSMVTADGVLVLTPEVAGSIARYVHAYGRGGFQGRLESVLKDLTSLARALQPIAA